MRRAWTPGVAAAALALLSVPAHAQDDGGLAPPKKGLSLGQVAEAQKDPGRAALDDSIRLLRTEAYGEAAVQLYPLTRAAGPYRDEAQYNLAKSLYRMGMLHSALHYFGGLLAKGPKHRFHDASLEWSLFIGRKMVDDEAVNELVARYSSGTFPAEYRDEFMFRLARFHFARALAIESGEIAGALGEPAEVESKSGGGLSISGDVFGADPFADDPPEPEKKADKKGGGLSIEEDIFGFGDPEPEPKKKKKKAAPSKPAPRGEGLAMTPKEHLIQAERFVTRVSDESSFSPRARYLEALLAYKGGKENDALSAFKRVVELTREEDTRKARRLRENAFFQLARTHFGASQPTFSIFYYDKVDRDSFAWLDALYEASWAEFRLGNYEKALGNLLTVHAPFFDDLYYPESRILKAVIYYENCRYPEAKDILTRFLARYEPVLGELDRLAKETKTADDFYTLVDRIRSDDFAESSTGEADPKVMTQVLDIALTDPELKRLDASYREVLVEIDALGDAKALSGSELSAELQKILSDQRSTLARQAGRAVKNQLVRERAHIKDLIQQAIRIDIETSRSEQERIESELRQVQSRPKRVAQEFVEWADDEKLVWPFEGEYWRDELGTYELTLAHSCR